jgi:outer membrane protein
MTSMTRKTRYLAGVGSTLAILTCLSSGALAEDVTAQIANPSPSAAAGPASLLEAYMTAKSQSPVVGSVHAGEKAAHYGVRDAYFGFLPRASMSLDMQRERQDVFHTDNPVYQVGKGYFGNRGYSFQLVQPIVDPVAWADLYSAHAGQRLAHAQATATEQKLTYSVIEAYLTVLAALDDERLARAEEADYAAHLDDARQRQKRGMGTRTESAQFEAQIEKSRSDVIAAHANIGKTMATLQRVTNVPVHAMLPLRDTIPMAAPTPANPEEWIAMEHQLSPELLALAASVDMADAEYKRSIARDLPHIDFILSDNYLDSGGSLYGGGARTDERVAEFRLSIPLFNADGHGYPAAANREKWRQAKFDSDEKRLEIDERVRTAYLEAKRDAEAAGSLASAVTNRRIVRDDMKRKFAAGLTTATDLVDAERDYVRAERELLGSHYNYLLNTMQLKREVGQISEDDVRYVDSLLDQGHAYVEMADNKTAELTH